MRVVAARGKREIPSELAVNKRFGKFGPEKEQTVRETYVKEDKALERLKTVWKNWDHSGKRYDDAVTLVKDLRYSAKDVENFSIALAEFQDEKNFAENAGLFLSALINQGDDEDYVIHTNHLPPPIELAYRNVKNITILGNVGYYFGLAMESGNVVVEGNAAMEIGYVGPAMKGGSITVNGDCGWDVGNQMEGGSITVNGSVGSKLGRGMRGGKITVTGNAKVLVGNEMEGGTITVRYFAGGGLGEGMKGGTIDVWQHEGLGDIKEGRIIERGYYIPLRETRWVNGEKVIEDKDSDTKTAIQEQTRLNKFENETKKRLEHMLNIATFVGVVTAFFIAYPAVVLFEKIKDTVFWFKNKRYKR